MDCIFHRGYSEKTAERWEIILWLERSGIRKERRSSLETYLKLNWFHNNLRLMPCRDWCVIFIKSMGLGSVVECSFCIFKSLCSTPSIQNNKQTHKQTPLLFMENFVVILYFCLWSSHSQKLTEGEFGSGEMILAQRWTYCIVNWDSFFPWVQVSGRDLIENISSFFHTWLF